MAYNILGKDDENLRVTVTEAETPVINIQPAFFTITGAGEVNSVNGLTGHVVLTTSEIAEGTNLYYTEARVDANIAGKTTTDLAEGANLYYTDVRVDNHLADGTITDIKTSQLTLTGGTGTQGQVTWNGDEETLDVITNGSVLQLGQEVVYHVRNNTGSPIADGTPVYVTGTIGASGRLTVAPFIANNTIPAQFFIGLTTETIEAGGDGKVTHFGKVRGINTSAYPEGSVLYVSPTVAGGLTTVEPEAPNLKLPVVFVVNSANNGTLFIRATTGIDLHSNHRVQVANLADNDLFVWDNAQTRWENRTIASLDLATQTWVSGQNYLTSFTETDPLFQASPAGTITNANIINWNTAWGWGNHADAGYLTSYTETDPVFTASPAGSITTLQKTNWDTAYSWGNHATAGYLTSYTETDPVFSASPSAGITAPDITNWNTAYSWGNHALAGYLTSFTETDPVFTASPAGSITAPDITNWNTAYSWGNHATQGYLTSYTETDPVFLASPSAGILAGDITNWNTAYGWGDHSTAGYLSSVALNDVTDVVLTAPSVDQVLKYDGANWVNADAPSAFDGDLLGNNLLDSTRNYFLIGDDVQPTNGDLFSTSTLYGGINTVSEVNPDNVNLLVANGRTAKIKLTQSVGTGGANSERMRANYDELIIDTNGFNATTASSGRGFNGQFVNVKINNTGLTSSNVGTITGNITYLNQGTLTSGMTIDRLQGNLAAFFATGVTVGDAVGYRYERYGSMNITGQEYSFYSVPSGAKLYNNGPAQFAGDVDVTNGSLIGSLKTSSIQATTGNTIDIKDDNANNIMSINAGNLTTSASYGGRINLETTGNDTGDIMGIALRTTGNDKAILFNAHGDILMDGGQGGTDITHGVTMWGHGRLGLTIDRDLMYTGKPFQFYNVPVGTTAPNVGVEQEGEHWLDTTTTPVLKTWRTGAWIPIYDEKDGLAFYDSTNHKVYIRNNGAWIELGGGAGGGATQLNDLSDVTVTAPSDGDILRYNGIAGEFQNTNLGLSLTPTLATIADGFAGAPMTVTITNYGSYQDANIFAEVKDNLGAVVVPNSAITDNYDGTFTFIAPTDGTGYTVEVKVQDFGDLASDTAISNTFNTSSPTFQHWRIVYPDATSYNMLDRWQLYTGSGQTGTALPSVMTSNTAPAPYVASGSSSYAGYDFYEAFNTGTGVGNAWWNLGGVYPNAYLAIDLGSPQTILSHYFSIPGVSYRSGSYVLIQGSTTGAWAGEEQTIFNVNISTAVTFNVG